MGKIDKKLEQIRLQHDISEMLRQDNGVSCHFDYHVNLLSDDETIKLNLLTYNKRHDEYMLLHSIKGKSSIDCLIKMKNYLDQLHTEREYSFSVSWKKKGEDQKHVSYFVAASREEAEAKFLHEKNPDDYEYSIQINPVS